MEIYNVSEALYYLKILLECDNRLNDVWLQGEVSGLKRYPSGHLYFNLKDGAAQISCVLFKKSADRHAELPRDGSSYIMHGFFDLYESRGQIQFNVNLVQTLGLGRLNLEYEALKQRLDDEGLFALERKRPLPSQPKIIGVVTSPMAAAFQDILNVLGRRYPLAQVVLSPTQVQGETAPPQIVRALQLLNSRSDVDVIILARGGGSLEDLWAFNDEQVARAVFASRAPVITGVGHEVDTTIVDYVSDMRAPTPSAAAELVSPNIEDLRLDLQSLNDRLYTAVRDVLDTRRYSLEDKERGLQSASPALRIAGQRGQIANLQVRCKRELSHTLAIKHGQVSSLTSRLAVLNPTQILQRGYAIVTRPSDGTVVAEIFAAISGETLQVRVKDGTFDVLVD